MLLIKNSDKHNLKIQRANPACATCLSDAKQKAKLKHNLILALTEKGNLFARLYL